MSPHKQPTARRSKIRTLAAHRFFRSRKPMCLFISTVAIGRAKSGVAIANLPYAARLKRTKTAVRMAIEQRWLSEFKTNAAAIAITYKRIRAYRPSRQPTCFARCRHFSALFQTSERRHGSWCRTTINRLFLFCHLYSCRPAAMNRLSGHSIYHGLSVEGKTSHYRGFIKIYGIYFCCIFLRSPFRMICVDNHYKNIMEEKMSISGINEYHQETIIVTEELEKWHLDGLYNTSIDAVRINNYYRKKEAKVIADIINKSPFWGRYVNARKIGRIGQAFFECQHDKNSLRRYKENTLIWLKEMRRSVHPYFSPIDKLRIELDELWPEGFSLAKVNERKLFAGIVREFKKGSYAEPHNDVLRWDLPEGQSTAIDSQITANVYLLVPERGGELCLWPKWPSKEEYNAIRHPGSYDVKRKCIGKENIKITPQLGELILFNPMRIHSVEKIHTGSRLTWSCFIGKQNENHRLEVWS